MLTCQSIYSSESFIDAFFWVLITHSFIIKLSIVHYETMLGLVLENYEPLTSYYIQ